VQRAGVDRHRGGAAGAGGSGAGRDAARPARGTAAGPQEVAAQGAAMTCPGAVQGPGSMRPAGSLDPTSAPAGAGAAQAVAQSVADERQAARAVQAGLCCPGGDNGSARKWLPHASARWASAGCRTADAQRQSHWRG